MNLSYFISKRVSRETQEGFSSIIHKIAIASIGIGLAASIVSFLIMKGFQETVKNKVYSFSGHLLITKLTLSNSPEEEPINFKIDPYLNSKQYSYINHIQEYTHKPGLIKANDEVLGVVVKGVGQSFDQRSFSDHMIAGEFISFPDSGYAKQIVLSKIIADKLNANVGEEIVVHFFQNPPRVRRLQVSGIYETNLSENFDSKVILSDIRMIQKLNDWSDSLAGGMEVFIKDTHKIDDAGYDLADRLDYDLSIQRVSDKYLNVFEWLNLLSRQVNILLVIILIVVSVNMISIVLILVMERTQMIGMLKAMGGSDALIRSIFFYNGLQLIVKGLVLGNVLGLGLCAAQFFLKPIKLNPHDYYMSYVPISWHWELVIFLNLLTLLVVSMVLLLPTMAIAKISPIKSIKFD